MLTSSTARGSRTCPRPDRGAPEKHQQDFLSRFTQVESRNRVAKKRERLSVLEHEAHREGLKRVRFINRRYADETKMNVAGIFSKWKRYCREHRVGEWREALERHLTREITMDFFLHVCEVSRIESWGTSQQYILQFQLLYTNVTGRRMDRNDAKEPYIVQIIPRPSAVCMSPCPLILVWGGRKKFKALSVAIL
ncbi:hypothetical protein DL762_008139 [Monosporascus cannonballus]|uniref:BZIP domain-containing protein n=1 Tax=Monosporascus cannonballus TaxID=155416 RepID=A0ABY0GX34_9PEZI|nr:hypothetical protein DL762_008139 [Monosporascus cannonballus]RYO89751.1 hypothetical protein DL763_005553 [Monosporascus cannonballus]